MKYTQENKRCIRCGNMRSDYTKGRKTCDRCLKQTGDYQKQKLAETKEHRTIRARKYRKTPKGKLVASETQIKQYAKFPEKAIARVLTYRAVKTGRISKHSCQVCGSLKVEAHHMDYSKPLKVIWLCKSHHMLADKMGIEFELKREQLNYLFQLQYGKSFTCPKCGKEDSFYFIKKNKRFDCSCGYSLFPLSGTIFHKSSTPLSKWFYAIYLIASKEEVSAKELQRELGVTYKTAYRIKKQILLLGKGTFKEMLATAVKPVSANYERTFS